LRGWRHAPLAGQLCVQAVSSACAWRQHCNAGGKPDRTFESPGHEGSQMVCCCRQISVRFSSDCRRTSALAGWPPEPDMRLTSDVRACGLYYVVEAVL
jgi:hypothetical protein